MSTTPRPVAPSNAARFFAGPDATPRTLWCNIPMCGASPIQAGANRARRSESRAAGAAASTFPVSVSGRPRSLDEENPISPTGFSCPCRSRPRLLAPACEKYVAPKLEIEQPPDAIGAVFASRTMPLNERVHLAEVEVSRHQPIGGAHASVYRFHPRVAQPLCKRSREPHLFAVDDAQRKQAADSGFQNVLLLSAANLQPIGNSGRELHQLMVEKRHAALHRSGHAHLILLHEQLDEVRFLVGVQRARE